MRRMPAKKYLEDHVKMLASRGLGPDGKKLKGKDGEKPAAKTAKKVAKKTTKKAAKR